MSLRLRPDARALTAAALLVAVAVMPAGRSAAAAQAANPGSLGDLLDRVSRYVQTYYTRAQSLMVEETVTVQPVRADLSPDGFAASPVVRLALRMDARSAAPRSRASMSCGNCSCANNRPARPGAEPKCLDPMPVTPEPLEFLLPTHHGDFEFIHAGPTQFDGRAAVLLDYKPRSSGTPTAKVDPKGTNDMECVLLDVPRRFRGRIWVDPDTDAVLRIDETLVGPTEVPVPRKAELAFSRFITLMRSDSTVRYTAVRFSDPDETLMLPTTIENVWVTGVERYSRRADDAAVSELPPLPDRIAHRSGCRSEAGLKTRGHFRTDGGRP